MKRFLKKLLCWTLISNCFLMTAYAAPAWPAGPDIQAEAGVVIDMDSGAILAEKRMIRRTRRPVLRSFLRLFW